MNITTDNKYMIFKKDGQYGAMYSIGLSKKNQKGQYENGYMPVRFKKDVELDDRTEIYIKDAWLTFYKKDNTTVPYVFINEFKNLDEAIQPTKETLEQNDPYKQFGEEVEITDEMLPF